MSQEYTFQAEISQLLSIIINTFYSNKEIFLRELISNASDAIDKVRYTHLQNPELNVLGDTTDLKITIVPDPVNKCLIIEDTGIGMTQQDLIDNLGTIAHSGTKQFMEAVTNSQDASLIGQFGVGFYSAFLVAKQVDVYSRHYSSPDTYLWSSTASGSYHISQVEDSNMSRGTRLVLHLKEEEEKYLDEGNIRNVIKKHSQFISYPIYLQVTKVKLPEEDDVPVEEEKEEDSNVEINEEEEEEIHTDPVPETETENSDTLEVEGTEEDLAKKIEEELDTEEKPDTQELEAETPSTQGFETELEVINQSTPIWLKSKSEVTEEEYSSFYKTITQDWDEPLIHNHFNVEGGVSFKALLYVPKQAPFDMFTSKTKNNNIKLYVRRVFITDSCEQFVPDYFNFVKGVVDSDDLPLNISREMLQETNIFKSIQKQLVKKITDMLQELSQDEEKYLEFYNNFSKNIKLGVHEDESRREKLASLLRYPTTNSQGKLVSLDSYVSNLKEGQHDIYYITGDSLESIESSTHLDIFRKKGLEVMLMTEAIDEYCVNQLRSFKDHNLVNVTRNDIEIPETDEEKKELEKMKTDSKDMCQKVKEVLGNRVSDVTVSNRLSGTPCCVSVGGYGWTANMEKIMKAQAMSNASMMSYMKSQKSFQLNPNHNIVKSLQVALDKQDNEKEVDIGTKNLIVLLFETALQDAGFTSESPRVYAHRVYSMVELGLGYPIEPPTNSKIVEEENESVHVDEEEDIDMPLLDNDTESTIDNSESSETHVSSETSETPESPESSETM